MSFFAELKRRNVFRVGIAYLVVAWLVMQVVDVMIDNIGAPDWLFKFVVLMLGIGFPVVLVFAWAFELTPEGLKKESEVDRSQSITRQTGRKLNFVIIGVLALALAYFIWESRFANQGSESGVQAGTAQSETPAGDLARTPQVSTTGNAIAVLPFANRSRLEDDEFFTDGIHDDLLTQLAKITGLKVISRTSVMEYRNTTKKIPEIAAELGVGKILEGGVQRAGQRIRINAQLIDVATDEHLWAETFDREMTVENIFDIQSEITRHIVEAVRGELTPEEAEAIGELPTQSLAAYEALLKARAEIYLPEYEMQKFIRADGFLQEAVRLDPEFGQAWAMLASNHGQYIWLSEDDSPERVAMLRDALAKAERYSPGEADTLAAHGAYLYRVKNDYRGAAKFYTQAHAVKPGDSLNLFSLGTAERRIGEFEQALAHYQAALELDPANLQARTLIAETLSIMKSWERLEPLVDNWMVQYPGTDAFILPKVSVLVEKYGDLAAARALFNTVTPLLGPSYVNTGNLLLHLSRAHADYLDFWSQPALAAAEQSAAWRQNVLRNRARAYRALGDAARAEQLLAEAIAAGEAYQSDNANNMAFSLEELARAHGDAGHYELALATARRARSFMPESSDALEGPFVSQGFALALARAGHREEALAEIERLLRTPGGFSRWQLHFDPDWDFMRDDPDFVALATPEGLQEAPP